MSDENKKVGKQEGDKKAKINWNDLPSGLLGWILWSIKRKYWRPVIWLISIAFAFFVVYPLFNIQQSIRKNTVLDQWNRSESPEWRVAFLNTLNERGDILPEMWDEASDIKSDTRIRRAVALHPHAPSNILNNMIEVSTDRDEMVVFPAVINLSRDKKEARERINRLGTVELDEGEEEVKILNYMDLNSREEIFRRIVWSIEDNYNRLDSEKRDRLSKEILQELRSALGWSPRITAELLESLSNKVIERIKIGRNLDRDSEEFEKVIKKTKKKIVTEIVENWNISPELLESLSSVEEDFIKESVILNPNINIKIINELSSTVGITLIAKLVEDSRTSSEVLDELSSLKVLKEMSIYKGGEYHVLSGIAGNPNAKTEVLEMLASPKLEDELGEYPYKFVRRALARNPSTSPEVLKELSSLAILKKMSSHENYMVKVALSENPSTPSEVLEKLSYDRAVEGRVARNPNTDLKVLKRLSTIDGHVKGQVAQNPSTSPEMLEKLSADKELHWSIARNPNASPKVLEKLSADKELHWLIANNPNTSQEVLQKLSKDDDIDVRMVVAGNSNTSEKILGIFSSDEDAKIRLKVAENKSTSFNRRMKLMGDSNLDVRRIALENILNLSDEEWEKAKKSKWEKSVYMKP